MTLIFHLKRRRILRPLLHSVVKPCSVKVSVTKPGRLPTGQALSSPVRRWITTITMGKWASGSSTTTADTAAREDRRGHGQLSPDPLPPGDPKQSSQPLECFA